MTWFVLAILFGVLCTLADRAWARHLDGASARTVERLSIEAEAARDQRVIAIDEQQEVGAARLKATREADAKRRQADESARIELQRATAAVRRPYLMGTHREGLPATPNGNRKQRLAFRAAQRKGR
ncbi:MAG: hypothetical protein M3Q55_09410 [Acidobacteriota bacterium]|nr:hypothetical protein [Acidobacteriota bacterium]